jgi:hypothetical protein
MEEHYARSAAVLETGFEDVHLDAVVVVDDAGANSHRQRVLAIFDVIISWN